MSISYNYIYLINMDEINNMCKNIFYDIFDDTFNNICIQNCVNIINFLKDKKNNEIMLNAYSKIYKIMCIFPPKKNINKFAYGSLVERVLYDTFCKLYGNTNCSDLNKIKSEYKNDILLNNEKYSIKTKKNISNIIVINKNNKQTHSIKDINFIIVFIEKKSLCIFPGNIITDEYIKDSGSKIEIKGKIYNKILKNSKYEYKFPESNKILKNYKEIDIISYIQENIINDMH